MSLTIAPTAYSPLVSQIMKSDADRNGAISRAEMQAWSDSKGGRGGNAATMFGAIDLNRDGSLSEGELLGFFTLPKLDVTSVLLTSSVGTGGLLDSLFATGKNRSQDTQQLMSLLQQRLSHLQDAADRLPSGLLVSTEA